MAGLKDMAAECRNEARACCDPELAELLARVAAVLEVATYKGECLSCAERPAEVLGECRPCYQRHRRATLGADVLRLG